MRAAEKKSVTILLDAVRNGDSGASAELLPLVYEELRHLARARLANEPPGQTLQPTALVHEAYLRLIGDKDPSWDNRGHFFGSAARAMRQILTDRARRKAAQKHGGTLKRIDPDDSDLAIEAPSIDLIALDEALGRLEVNDPRKARIVE